MIRKDACDDLMLLLLISEYYMHYVKYM